MRIGVDATGWTLRRGYGRFTRNALARLVELDDEATYLFYVGDADSDDLPPQAVRRRVAISGLPVADETRPIRDVVRLMRAVKRDAPDAFLFPAVYTFFPVLRTPTVVGVHDLIATELPELTLPTPRARLSWRLKERLAVRSATVLFTVSRASRAAIAKRFGLAEDTIALVSEAPDPVFHPRSDAEVAAARAEVGVGADVPFLVFAAGISPHKGLDTLLEAFVDAAAGLGTGTRLVVAGDLDENTFLSVGDALREQVARLGLEDRVLLPGFVSDDLLAALYTGAAAAVVPSRAEGFGLPAVEAAACGTATILSDLPSHHESLGDAPLFFPPGDVAALRLRLDELLGDDELRRARARQAHEAVSRLSWEAAAEELRELVRKAAR
jgi:glycosyltransferase involved in cell wall biosynthesis